MVNNQKLLELLESYKIEELKQALKENIREDLNKSAGKNKSELSIVKNIVNLSKKEYNRDYFSKAHTFTRGGLSYFGFTNGHYVIAGPESYNYEIAEDHERFKMETFFDGSQNEKVVVNMQELEMFAKDKQNKKLKKPYVIKTEKGVYIAFNANYMVDCLKYCGVDYFYYNPEKVRFCVKNPLLIENKETENNKLCLCLPVNCVANCNGACSAYDYMESWRKNEV